MTLLIFLVLLFVLDLVRGDGATIPATAATGSPGNSAGIAGKEVNRCFQAWPRSPPDNAAAC